MKGCMIYAGVLNFSVVQVAYYVAYISGMEVWSKAKLAYYVQFATP